MKTLQPFNKAIFRSKRKKIAKIQDPNFNLFPCPSKDPARFYIIKNVFAARV